jgi:hypothetical protein
MQKERTMTSAVEINFQQNCSFTQPTAAIQITYGAIAIGGSNSLELNGTFSFSTLEIMGSQIQIDNNSGNAPVAGTISIPINPTGGASNPTTITVNNFTGQARVSWGQGQYAVLAPGDPVTLNGLT